MVDYPHPVSSLLGQHLLASLLRSQATLLAYLLCFQSARCPSLSVWPTQHKFLSPLPAFVAAKEKLCILLPLFGTASSALSLIMGPDLCTERVFLYHGACWSPGLMLQLWRGLHTHCLLNFTAINKSSAAQNPFKTFHGAGAHTLNFQLSKDNENRLVAVCNQQKPLWKWEF